MITFSKFNKGSDKLKKITVSDILNLDIMKSGRLVAGEKGLSNEIRYVSVYDNIPTELDAKNSGL